MGALNEEVREPTHEAPYEDAEDEDDRRGRSQPVTPPAGWLGASRLSEAVQGLRAAAIELRLEDQEEGLFRLVSRAVAVTARGHQPVCGGSGRDAPGPEGSRVAHPQGRASNRGHTTPGCVLTPNGFGHTE